MILPSPYRLALATVVTLAALSPTFALSATDIPDDTPVNQLVASAKRQLAAGLPSEALTYFDVAISRDPQNYLTRFQRGATYLSLGRANKASEDFDKVLSIKPDFEGALLQRAKLRARDANWAGAREDYKKAGKEGAEEWIELTEAQGAAQLAREAADKQDWEACVIQAGAAIMVAATHADLRKLRSGCRFERGEILEGVADLQHLLQIRKGDTTPHLQISGNLFYSAGDLDKGIAQLSKCLQSDPDSKLCSRLRKQEKRFEKSVKKMEQLEAKRQLNSAAKVLVGEGEEAGLLVEVKKQFEQLQADGTIHKNAPMGLYNGLVEKACELYVELNNKKRAGDHCNEALTFNPTCLPGLLHRAQAQLDSDDFEPAIETLNQAKEHHGNQNKINEMLQKAHTLLKRSKTKDYYKVLGVTRDADERTIKKAYRSLVKQFHPDKAASQGTSKEDAEKKVVALNEAYEVLSDPEKKQQFDNGHDPNDPSGGSPFQGSPFGQGAGGQPIFFQSGGNPFGGGGANFKFHFQGM